MRFWTREVAGWLLLFLGLFVFFRSYQFLTSENHYILEGGALSMIGIILFRGGIHLLKIAVAAQVCMQTEEQVQGRVAAVSRITSPSRAPSRPVTIRRIS
jgi:hypothetical protein